MLNLKQLIKSPLLKNSFIVLTANLLANFFNYLYHFLTGRLLAPQQYGLLQSLIALTYLMGVIINSFSLAVIKTMGQKDKINPWLKVKWLEKISFKLSIFFWLFFMILFPVFKQLLHLQNFTIYFIFTLPLLLAFFSILYQSILRAQLKFIRFSVLGILATLIKTASALILILLGGQIFGALAGFLMANLVIVWLGWSWVKRLIPASKPSPSWSNNNFWNFSLLTLLTNLFLTSLYSTDIILVRYFFSDSDLESGLYAATAVLGKIIFFTASSVLLVSFPLFIKYKKNLSRLRLLFWLSFVFISGIGLMGIIVYRLFPNLIINSLYGQSYSQAALFLPSFALFMGLLALFNLLMQLLLALEKWLAAWLAALVALSQIFLIINRHLDLKMIINNSIMSLSLGLLLGVLLVNKVINETKK